MPNLDYYNTARMHQMVNSFQDIVGDGSGWWFLKGSRSARIN